MHRRPIGIACVAAVALTFVAGVLAAPPGQETVARTKAGDAAAAALNLQNSDLPSNWTGGKAKPNFSGDLGCTDYRPKQSDLVVVGAAAMKSDYQYDEIYGQTQIMKTTKMVKLDWQRTVMDSRVVPCLRKGLAKHAKVISLSRVNLGKLAQYTAAFRAVYKVDTMYGKKTIELNSVDLGAGRDEIGFVLTGLASDKSTLRNLELHVAHKLAARLNG